MPQVGRIAVRNRFCLCGTRQSDRTCIRAAFAAFSESVFRDGSNLGRGRDARGWRLRSLSALDTIEQVKSRQGAKP